MTPDIEYLTSLDAVRERSRIVFEAAQRNELTHFTYHPEKLNEVADYVVSVIDRDFANNYDKIPPHGRWQHFDVGGVPRVADLIRDIKDQGHDDTEVAKRLIDLFVVSVLLDAGAGDAWRYAEKDGGVYGRSEGIAVASLYMFKEGMFNVDREDMRVDAKGLQSIDEEALSKGFQITAENLMVGVGARAQLLSRLGDSLLKHPEIFGPQGRPGNLVDYMIKSATPNQEIDYRSFWSTLQTLLLPIWPANRTKVNSTPIGDAWPLSVLSRQTNTTIDNNNTGHASNNENITTSIQPFHKLTQWLAYSLMTPFTKVLSPSYTFKNSSLGTGLPEYRNGGLFIDLGLLSLKQHSLALGFQNAKAKDAENVLPMFKDSSDEIVEWRAMTVALLDEVFVLVKEMVGRKGGTITMAQMLEAGTWKAGREIAAVKRPEGKGSPILIDGDGTLF